MTTLLIRGGTVVNADRAFQADVVTQDGKIIADVAAANGTALFPDETGARRTHMDTQQSLRRWTIDPTGNTGWIKEDILNGRDIQFPRPDDRLMTRNLYLGADVSRALGLLRPRFPKASVLALLGETTAKVENTRAFNPDWHKPNGVSLLAAAPLVTSEALLCMADHLVEPSLYRAMIAHQLGTDALALGVDRRLGHPWVDEDDVTRVATRGAGANRRIVEIGKNIPLYDAYDTGVFKITPALFDELRPAPLPSLSDGVRALARKGRARVGRAEL